MIHIDGHSALTNKNFIAYPNVRLLLKVWRYLVNASVLTRDSWVECNGDAETLPCFPRMRKANAFFLDR